MKRLLLIRHAKSSREDFSLPDIDRPLNKRGRQNAPKMGEVLSEKKIMVDLILSSTSLRTAQTINAIAPKINYSINNINWDDRLYLCGWYDIIELISEIDLPIQTVCLVFHNPAITELANRLQKDKKFNNVPTCGICSILLEIDEWKDIDEDAIGKLEFFIAPKDESRYLA